VLSTADNSINPAVGTEYCVEVQGDVNHSHCFDLAFFNHESGSATEVEGFSLVLPYPANATRIVLTKGASGPELASRAISANAPSVTVTSPNGGETWTADGTYTVTWTASDADGDPLAYNLLYTVDGTNWLPLDTEVTDTQVDVDASYLTGSDNARIRVMASDGANTSSDESDGTFVVERKPPQVYVTSPEAGNLVVAPDAPILLEGSAYDLEDGVIDGASLERAHHAGGALRHARRDRQRRQHLNRRAAGAGAGGLGERDGRILHAGGERLVRHEHPIADGDDPGLPAQHLLALLARGAAPPAGR
jgi:hypothetical protein